MDYLTQCYYSRMRLYRDRPDVTTPGRWHWCPPGAVEIPYFHLFGSFSQDPESVKPLTPPVGEVPRKNGRTRGEANPRYLGQNWCGSQDVWENGALYAQRGTPAVDAEGIPICCTSGPPTPGGATPGGSAVFPSVAPGELLGVGVTPAVVTSGVGLLLEPGLKPDTVGVGIVLRPGLKPDTVGVGIVLRPGQTPASVPVGGGIVLRPGQTPASVPVGGGVLLSAGQTPGPAGSTVGFGWTLAPNLSPGNVEQLRGAGELIGVGLVDTPDTQGVGQMYDLGPLYGGVPVIISPCNPIAMPLTLIATVTDVSGCAVAAGDYPITWDAMSGGWFSPVHVIAGHNIIFELVCSLGTWFIAMIGSAVGGNASTMTTEYPVVIDGGTFGPGLLFCPGGTVRVVVHS
jgi:hypothetical protein